MDMVKEAEVVYSSLKDKLKGQEGKIVAIDSETGDYFVGETVIDAYKKGHKKHPTKKFFFQRIGDKAVYRVG